MKLQKKDLIFLIVPLIIVGIIYPFLPEKIPRQFRLDGSVAYMAKEFVFLLGILPFVVYRQYQGKKK